MWDEGLLRHSINMARKGHACLGFLGWWQAFQFLPVVYSDPLDFYFDLEPDFPAPAFLVDDGCSPRVSFVQTTSYTSLPG
jgi:hypothetical protein